MKTFDFSPISTGGSQSVSAARSEARTARSDCPPSLTGGESPTVKVDWCTLTYLPNPERVDSVDFDAMKILESIMNRTVFREGARGMFGYEQGVKFNVLLDDGHKKCVARLDFGGLHHGQRARLDITGSGCSIIRNDGWLAFQDFTLQHLEPKLTRVDLAADFLHGEFTVIDCKNWYEAGLFNAGGRNPRHGLQGDWLKPVYGRTFEVGRRENGKMLRAYEKGKQLGDPNSDWTRFEVEIRNIDRVIPLNVLTDCNTFFVGSYKCLEQIVSAAAQRIPTEQKESQISLQKLVDCASSSYGRLLNVLGMFMTPEEVFHGLSRRGVPSRLERAALHDIQKMVLDDQPSI